MRRTLCGCLIAHAKPKATGSEDRQMAHDRGPPEGYVECFRPNISIHANGKLGLRVRAQDLTANEIRRCEERFLAAASS